MRAQKFFLIGSITFMLSLLIFLSGFQVIKVATISGVIESSDKDSGFIVVGEANISVSADTRIMDEKGKILNIQDLNANLSVEVEGIQNPGGFTATKIIVKTPKKRP